MSTENLSITTDILEHTKEWNRSWTAVISSNDRIYAISKRHLDICLSATLLIILLPILVIIVILIKLDSADPVIFTQKRVSSRVRKRNGYQRIELYEFPCRKFRTMVHYADGELHRIELGICLQNIYQ
jgi:lipopolysaccharide/colanic/teichoic acid biosynthesis glycosyltransferase